MNSNDLSVIILRRWGFNNVKVVRFFIKQEGTPNKYVEIRGIKKRLTKRTAGEFIMRKDKFSWNISSDDIFSDDLFLDYINRFVSVNKYIITKRYKIT